MNESRPKLRHRKLTTPTRICSPSKNAGQPQPLCRIAVQIIRPSKEGKTQWKTHIEFRGALVERRAAANAGVHAGRGVLVVFARARALCALLAEDPELEQRVRRNAKAAKNDDIPAPARGRPSTPNRSC